jgi:lipoate-protein ligase A
LILNGKKYRIVFAKIREQTYSTGINLYVPKEHRKKFFRKIWGKNADEFLETEIRTSIFDNNDIKQAQKVAEGKFSNSQLNKKF